MLKERINVKKLTLIRFARNDLCRCANRHDTPYLPTVRRRRNSLLLFVGRKAMVITMTEHIAALPFVGTRGRTGISAGREQAGVPLSLVQPGREVRVRRIHGKAEVKRFLNDLGFVENADVCVIAELDGNVIVSVKGTRVAVSKVLATHISTVEE